MKTQRLLIVNADEFGRSPGINEGVIEAHQRGVVTSASVMVRRPAAEAAAELSRGCPDLSVGLHVDLGEWRCRDGVWSLVDEVVPLDDEAAVDEEVLRQLGAFQELFGRDPTHLDSHQNVHMTGPALSALVALARRLDIPLRHVSREIFVCSGFHGQTSRGDPFPEGITVETFLALLRTLPDGISLLVCHPGRGGAGAGSYTLERERELEVLCNPRVRDALAAYAIGLGSFDRIGHAAGLDERQLGELESTYRERGRFAYGQGNFTLAESWFEKAARVGADRPWPWLWLARAQVRNGNPEGSRESIRKALCLTPGWPPGLLHLTDLHLAEGRSAEAAQLLSGLAIRNGSDGPELARAVGRRVQQMDDSPRALRVAELLARTHPHESSALATKAITLWKSGDREGARRFLASPPCGSNGAQPRAAAEFHLEAGSPELAWKLLRGDPAENQNARLLARVAQALRKAGDLTRAWEAFDAAIASGATDESTRRWQATVVGEVQVLSGAARPSLERIPHYRPVPGRVLHLVGKSLPYHQTGYSVRTRYVTAAQQSRGLEPHVATQLGFPWSEQGREAPLWEEVEGVPHHRLPVDGGAVPARLDDRLEANAHALARLVQRVRPAALHAASDYRNALLALAVGEACGIPVVYEVRGFWEDTWASKQAAEGAENTVVYRWRRERELECMRRADRVVTLADVMKSELVERGIRADKIVVVPNAVDPEAFHPVERDEALAHSLGLRREEVVVGYVSSFVAYEGIHVLLASLARLVERGVPVRGLLVGDGQERERLEARARELGLADRVLFTGRVPHDEVARYYGLIDVFVVPRTADRVCRLVTPLKPYEAMAMERAVVVSGVDALREMIVPGRTGLVFRPEDPDDLADVLEPLIRSPERRHALGAAARKWVFDHRTWAQNGNRYRRLFQELGVLPPTPRDEGPGVLRRTSRNGWALVGTGAARRVSS